MRLGGTHGRAGQAPVSSGWFTDRVGPVFAENSSGRAGSIFAGAEEGKAETKAGTEADGSGVKPGKGVKKNHAAEYAIGHVKPGAGSHCAGSGARLTVGALSSNARTNSPRSTPRWLHADSAPASRQSACNTKLLKATQS